VGRKSDAVRIRLLGVFRVSVGDNTVPENAWRLRKAAALVKLLALAHGHRLHREQAMDLLWPELRARAASNNLRQALHAARRALDSDPVAGSRCLTSQDELLALCPEGQLWVDSEAFEEAARYAHRAREPASYEVALDLYAGELLPGDRYEEWAEQHRRRLRETFLSLLLGLARLHEDRADHDSAAQVLRRVVGEDPTREEAHVGLMRLYALKGNRGEALAQYRQLEAILLTELGTKPAAPSHALREEIAAGRFPPKDARPIGSPPAEVPGAVKHNLPAPRTSFVGRESEMMEVKRELSMTRLLTLTGAGGTGKTRLALEVAHDLAGAYSDGVWLVELAGLSEDNLVPQVVAGVIGVPERPGQPLTDSLAEYLRAKSLLLVLDNCEHLAKSVAHLIDPLLDSCPRLRVLTTSREALGLAGEVVWRLPALSMPGTDRLPAPGEMTRYEAVRLFAERARLRLPAFKLTQENALAVAEVCRKLEGIPLAIELATARMGALSVGQISERLEDPLGLLTSGGRTAVSRQQTLRGTLDWSHELLSESEQTLFGRLSAFAGGWTLEAVEEVGSGDGLEKGDILDLLSGLVEKSLVVAKMRDEDRVRYRMLEPVRQYALEKLEEGGEGEKVRRRHAECFLALANEAEPALWGPEGEAWVERLETEHSNMRAALSWSTERAEADMGLRLGAALWPFWDRQGYISEGRKWLEEALARDSWTSAAVRAKALEGSGWMAYFQGDIRQSAAAAEEGVQLSVRAEIERSLAASLRVILGFTAEMQGDFERATELHEEALALSREAADKRAIANSLLGLGGVWSFRGDHKRATELLEEGVALAREVGDAVILARLVLSLGYEVLLEGDYDRGAALSEEAATLFRERGHKSGLEFALDNLGEAALLQGDHQRARMYYEESLVVCKQLGNKWVASRSLEGLACISGAEGAYERASKLFGAAEALGEAVGLQPTPVEDALRERYLPMTRSRLNETAWQGEWAQGRAMSIEEAIGYALSEGEQMRLSSPASKRPSSDEPPLLTRREKEVATLIARGLTSRQIAARLVLSERTVDNHVANILKKLSLHSREQIAARMAEQPPRRG
jgi:predicted ATPase/DNA-binding SARP family transcriptional activator/DNA-binding CsgD family transcriptional regulator